MRYIGFDMGDGESAVAIYKQGSGIEPMIQPIAGSRSLLSAVGMVNGEIVVGEHAYTDVLAEGLSVRFKSRFTFDTSSYETVQLFVKGVLNSLRKEGALQEGDTFVVGCPAGWNAAARARYHDLLVRAGICTPQVISESRAAFLYAKYAKTVALDIDVLQQSALVIDLGSSTLDFAYIVDGRETGIGTFGEIQLGGGALDAEILRRAVEKSRSRDKLQAVFSESKSWYSYCEIEARRLKELYFIRETQGEKVQVKKQLRVFYDGMQKLQLSLDMDEVENLVHAPLEELGGKSFSVALFDALREARQITAAQPPQVVLLTGGASRMQFFQQQCRETFPDALVVTSPEPEFSIAKGLAYAGWIDENMRAFRQAVTQEITDDRVAGIAREALPELIPAVANVLTDLLVEQAAIPVVSRWKQGEIDTLLEMNVYMQERVENALQSPMAQQALEPVIQTWIQSLSWKLQTMVDPICDRYQVPRREMKLSFFAYGKTGGMIIGAKEILDFSVVATVMGVVISVVGGLLGGGGGIALIATGPAGFLAGLAIGAVIAVIGWSTMSTILMKASFPRIFRWINVEKKLRSQTTKDKLREAIQKELGGDDNEFSLRVTNEFTGAFQKYLRQVTQAAEIPIQ